MLNPRKDERLSDLTIRNVTMRQILIEIEDEAYEQFMGMMELCPQIIVVDDGNIPITENLCDLCMKQAIDELQRDRVIRRPRDYGWIMSALDQGLVADIEPFTSPSRFREYLKLLDIQPLPSKTTISSAYNNVLGDFPDWTFMDDPDATEVLRRKNVVNRFRSAFMRAKRAKLTTNLDKRS